MTDPTIRERLSAMLVPENGLYEEGWNAAVTVIRDDLELDTLERRVRAAEGALADWKSKSSPSPIARSLISGTKEPTDG